VLTKRELITLWKEYGFRATRRYGQNFLIDRNVKDKIIRFINPGRDENILEIGSGFGELTIALAHVARHVTAVEKDRRIIRIFNERLIGGEGNISLEACDFLDYPMKKRFDKIVGNLPYYVTTPILERLLERCPLGGIYIMVQREYADRLCAEPGCGDYSSLSIYVRFYADVRKLLTVKRSCFFPVPKIDSVFLELRPLEKDRVIIKDKGLFFKIVRGSFQQRRKKVSTALCGQKIVDIDKNKLNGILEKVGVANTVRPEELSIEQFAAITNLLCKGDRGL